MTTDTRAEILALGARWAEAELASLRLSPGRAAARAAGMNPPAGD